ELLGERTVANAQKARLHDPSGGFDPTLVERIRLTAPHCAAQGIRIVTNGGAANPVAAGHAVLTALDEMGIDMAVAVVTGDDVLEEVRAENPMTWEDSLPAVDVGGRLTSANAYLGAAGIREALGGGAQIVITGRVADPSLYVGPLSHAFGWSDDDQRLTGKATAIGHLLECGGQVTGGYFADPGTKPIEGLDRLGFPFADVAEDGYAVIGKLPGTGGAVTVRSCTEQLLYEVANPGAYITPDVVADFSGSCLKDNVPPWFAMFVVHCTACTTDLNVILVYLEEWDVEGIIPDAVPRAIPRAQLAAYMVSRLMSRDYGISGSVLSFDFI